MFNIPEMTFHQGVLYSTPMLVVCVLYALGRGLLALEQQHQLNKARAERIASFLTSRDRADYTRHVVAKRVFQSIRDTAGWELQDEEVREYINRIGRVLKFDDLYEAMTPLKKRLLKKHRPSSNNSQMRKVANRIRTYVAKVRGLSADGDKRN